MVSVLPEAPNETHRCPLCRGWRGNWHLCRSLARTRLPDSLSTHNQSQVGDSRSGLDVEFRDELNRRLGAIEDWWMHHELGPYNEDHCCAVAMDFDDMPLEEILSTLEVTLSRARQIPRTLRYFKVALQEARGQYFKAQDYRREPGTSTGAALDRILGRQNRHGGDS